MKANVGARYAFCSVPRLADQEAALNSLFGTDEWKQARELTSQERLRFLHDLFYRQLKRECGLTYVRAFEIVTAQPNSGYTLFFGTRNERGLEKMKQSMWSIDPVEGQRSASRVSRALPSGDLPEASSSSMKM